MEPPHEAMFLVLAYLPVFELLVISQVCRSLRDALKNDILPWLNIVVEKPLSSRLSDDKLIMIASKANGRLTTLVLISCEKITDDGLQKIIEQNPQINKLYVPGCTGLTPEGIIRTVKMLTKDDHKLLSLKLNGIYNINKEHLETLGSLMVMSHTQYKQWLPKLLYHKHKKKNYLRRRCKEEEADSGIDMKICPKCDEVRMVFDCPRETCEKRKQCRGCYLCIPRCEECGGCIDIEEVEDAACADTILCLNCWLQLPKCNFCNKPYCTQHAYRKQSLPNSSGFVCEFCHANFIL